MISQGFSYVGPAGGGDVEGGWCRAVGGGKMDEMSARQGGRTIIICHCVAAISHPLEEVGDRAC